MTDTPPSLLTADDIHLFNEGSHFNLYEKFGAHPVADGTRFAVWAPNAERVSVVGDFNIWDKSRNPLSARDSSGIWEGFILGVGKGALYKYHIVSRGGALEAEKADPFAFHNELPPKSASVVWPLDHAWADGEWMRARWKRNALDAPMSIYEMHLGSWRHAAHGHSLSYRELAPQLADYASGMGFTHVEFLPPLEHPFYGSWGYQVTGYFAPTSRFGTPQDFMFLIDTLHRSGIGVIFDWVPSHFATDAHALGMFDGTHLYEHADERQGIHPDWNSYIFNYGRNEVRSFLISGALFWLDKYHIDGLRVDAVASMLYLDYSRKEGDWIANPHGGRENLEAISFLRRFNEEVYRRHPDVQTFAEESTSWPMVSRPTYVGGLGFGMKWDMGWMHDTLRYISHEPIHRKYHHNDLTFRMLYAFAENFVLPLSHDEVVHGKKSLLGKMPGDRWQRFANLRLLLCMMHAHAGKKLLFMGGELGQESEWSHDRALDWGALCDPMNRGVQSITRDLNHLHRDEPALHERDFDPSGFEWIDCNDLDQSVVALMRRGAGGHEIVVVFNCTPVPRHDYRVGVPSGGFWRELLNSDAADYGGSGQGNVGGVMADDAPWMGRPNSVRLTLPPLAALFLKRAE